MNQNRSKPIAVALDLENVLIPEIWPHLANHFKIPEFSMTTREIPEVKRLMQIRLEAIKQRRLSLRELTEPVKELHPFPRAKELVAYLQMNYEVMAVSDSFEELARPLLDGLGIKRAFLNTFIIDSDGRITDINLVVGGRKELIIKREFAGHRVVAVGDSGNDLSMLQIADHPILIHPTDSLKKALPQAPIASDLDEVRRIIENLENPDSSRKAQSTGWKWK